MKKLSLILISGVVCFSQYKVHADCGGGSSSPTDNLVNELDNFSTSTQVNDANSVTEAVIAVITDNASQLAAVLSEGDLSSCLNGDDAICLTVFNRVLKALKKLLIIQPKMHNSIHLIKARQVSYSPLLAKKISKILLDARK